MVLETVAAFAAGNVNLAFPFGDAEIGFAGGAYKKLVVLALLEFFFMQTL